MASQAARHYGAWETSIATRAWPMWHRGTSKLPSSLAKSTIMFSSGQTIEKIKIKIAIIRFFPPRVQCLYKGELGSTSNRDKVDIECLLSVVDWVCRAINYLLSTWLGPRFLFRWIQQSCLGKFRYFNIRSEFTLLISKTWTVQSQKILAIIGMGFYQYRMN